MSLKSPSDPSWKVRWTEPEESLLRSVRKQLTKDQGNDFVVSDYQNKAKAQGLPERSPKAILYKAGVMET